MTDVKTLAAQFVDLVLKHKNWREVRELPPEDTEVMLALVRLAGYEVAKIVPGELRGEYADTREKYTANTRCPFKALAPDGEGHFPATRRLDSALYYVLYRRSEPRERLIDQVEARIERGMALVPIPLTPDGDLLLEYPSDHRDTFDSLQKPTRDDSPLGPTVGVHACCGGWMDRKQTTPKLTVLFCRVCHLRVVFPRTVETYGQLRATLAHRGACVPD